MANTRDCLHRRVRRDPHLDAVARGHLREAREHVFDRLSLGRALGLLLRVIGRQARRHGPRFGPRHDRGQKLPSGMAAKPPGKQPYHWVTSWVGGVAGASMCTGGGLSEKGGEGCRVGGAQLVEGEGEQVPDLEQLGTSFVTTVLRLAAIPRIATVPRLAIGRAGITAILG